MRKAYVLVFNEATGGKEVMKGWANQDPAIIHWRSDLPHCMYLISEAEAGELSASLLKHIGKRGRFLIVEVGTNRQGLLTPESWYLFKHKQRMPKAD